MPLKAELAAENAALKAKVAELEAAQGSGGDSLVDYGEAQQVHGGQGTTITLHNSPRMGYNVVLRNGLNVIKAVKVSGPDAVQQAIADLRADL